MLVGRDLLAWARRRPRTVLVALVLLHVALHLRWIGLPPSGFHAWRQTQVLSIARNYAEESMNLLEPRVDSRGADSGITGLEFPLPYWLMAVGYRLLGFHHWVHRVVMLGFGAIAIVGAWRLGRALFGDPVWGLAMAALLILNPLFGYYSFVAAPDVPMLGFLLLGLAALSEPAMPPARSLVAGTLSLAVAALLKLSSAAAWPPALVDGWRRLRALRDGRASVAIAALVGGAAVAAWYLWARHLSDANHNHDFMLASKLPYPIAIVPGVARKVLMQWLPEVYSSYPQFVLVLVGLWGLRRDEYRPLRATLLAWALGLILYAIPVLPMLEMHDYFMTPVVVPLLILSVLGAKTLAEAGSTRPAAKWALAALLIACAVVGPYRALTRFVHAHPDPDLLAMESRLPALAPDRSARVVSAFDPSPSIQLYYMHRKGWPIQVPEWADSIAAMGRQGARYFISNSRAIEARPLVRAHLDSLGTIGSYTVFKIVP